MLRRQTLREKLLQCFARKWFYLFFLVFTKNVVKVSLMGQMNYWCAGSNLRLAKQLWPQTIFVKVCLTDEWPSALSWSRINHFHNICIHILHKKRVGKALNQRCKMTQHFSFMGTTVIQQLKIFLIHCGQMVSLCHLYTDSYLFFIICILMIIFSLS